jgi:hypothetical protein
MKQIKEGVFFKQMGQERKLTSALIKETTTGLFGTKRSLGNTIGKLVNSGASSFILGRDQNYRGVSRIIHNSALAGNRFVKDGKNQRNKLRRLNRVGTLNTYKVRGL